MVRTRRQVAAQRGELITSAFEHSAVRDFIGKGRYLQLALSKSLARAYSSRFGALTSKSLSNIAAEQGELTLVSWARDAGCNWDVSVFLSGIKGGQTQTLQHLVDNGCPAPEGKDACACAAATEGGLDVLVWLRERGFDWDEAVCTTAAARGDLPLLQWIHEHGCPWTQDEVFEAAAGGGHINILEWGLESGVVFDEMTCGAAAKGGSLETLQFLRAHECPWDDSVILLSILKGHCDVFLWAREHGCPYNPHWVGPRNIGYLHVAILGRSVDMVNLLIRDGFNVDRPYLGRKPIHTAVMTHQVDIALALINAGASLNVRDDQQSETPLMMACWLGQLPLVKILLSRNVDTEICDKDGRAPLFAAASSGPIDVVSALLEVGANPNHDSSPLEIAVHRGHLQIAKLLASYGAKE